ncbi:MAG: class I SAM-dependent methyltransferase [Novosphingobium sp.]|nr:class I SAM-dependent methyltransferase [Novosphingobium sp.]MCP5401497.1 class I SAM-dependent methyltransferase [Novosphingobium sp.]
MGLARRFAEQLARPQGVGGRLLGSAMDIANRKPTQLAVDMLAPQDGEHILDAGCGTGAGLAEVLRRADCAVTGIDPSDTMLASARRRLGPSAHLVRAGLEALSFPDGTFDAALLLNVLYFCDEDGRMTANLRRVLRPGGRLVAYVTHRDTMLDWPFAQEGLHRLFDRDRLIDALAAGGFARDRICVQETSITRSVRGLIACAER